MHLILIFAAIAFALILPVMLAARVVGADRTGFGSAFLAVIFQTLLSIALKEFVHSQTLEIVIALVGGSAIYAFTLGTSLIKGFFVSIIATIITLVVIFMLASSFSVMASAT